MGRIEDSEMRPPPPAERRNGPPRWEVVRGGQRLGVIVETKLGGARLPSTRRSLRTR